MMTTIVLVDDHDLVRESLSEKLGAYDGFSIVAQAGSVKDGLARVREHKPHVLLLDIRLQDGSGLQMIEPVRKASPGTRIIMLTMYAHPRYAKSALEKGADGFVLKGASFEELIKAIQSVQANKSYVSPELGSAQVIKVTGANQPTPLERLSSREFEVLTLMGQGESLKEAATILGINEKSVSTYLSRVMDKLQLRSRAELVRFALEEGLLE